MMYGKKASGKMMSKASKMQKMSKPVAKKPMLKKMGKKK